MSYNSKPVHTRDMKIRTALAGPKDAYDFITSPKWIAFNGETEFLTFLENTVFTPGTQKNAELEVLMTPVEIKGEGQQKIMFWWRIWDTPKNRQAFTDAYEIFYKSIFSADWKKNFGKKLVQRRRHIREILSYDDNKLYIQNDGSLHQGC